MAETDDVATGIPLLPGKRPRTNRYGREFGFGYDVRCIFAPAYFVG